jgi:hypothetical protein
VAESSWPSPDNGRTIDDASYEKLAIGYGAAAGVIGDFTNPQLVYGDASGMQVKIAADRYAIVRGHTWWSGSTIFTQAIAANSSGSTRTDLIVLRLSRTTWNVNLTVIQGTPGSGVPTSLQDLSTTGSYDLPLATVTVASGASSISAANVTYVGMHLTPDGSGLRSPSYAALSYVAQKTEGQVVDVADGNIYRYHNSAWGQVNTIWVRKITGTARTSTTTVTIDPDMKVTLPPNQTYIFMANLVYSSGASIDMRGGFAVPNNGLWYGTIRAQGPGASSAIGPIVTDAQTNGSFAYGFGGAGTGLNLTGFVFGIALSGDGGTFSFNWAQSTSSSTATTLRGNSLMVFIPIS